MIFGQINGGAFRYVSSSVTGTDYNENKCFFDLANTGGIVPATGETGTPEFMVVKNDDVPSSWISGTGGFISAVSEMGNGLYRSAIDFDKLIGEVGVTPPFIVYTRYKTAGTCESRGESFFVYDNSTSSWIDYLANFPKVLLIQDNSLVSATELTAGANVRTLYYADVHATIDSSSAQDEYTVIWYKNGASLASSGLASSGTIRIQRRADGTDLVSQTAMSLVTGTSIFKYNVTGSSRLSQGEAVIVTVAATIDSVTRTFIKIISRDKQ